MYFGTLRGYVPACVAYRPNAMHTRRLQHEYGLNIAFNTDIEWKLVYVGSAGSESFDQELDTCMVGPVPVGVNSFEFEVRSWRMRTRANKSAGNIRTDALCLYILGSTSLSSSNSSQRPYRCHGRALNRFVQGPRIR